MKLLALALGLAFVVAAIGVGIHLEIVGWVHSEWTQRLLFLSYWQESIGGSLMAIGGFLLVAWSCEE